MEQEKNKGFFFHHEDGRSIPLRLYNGCYDVSSEDVPIDQNQALIYCCMKDIEAWINSEVNKKQIAHHILLTEYNEVKQIKYIEVKFIYSLDKINLSIRPSLDTQFMDFGNIPALKSHANKVYKKAATLFDAKSKLNRFTFGSNFMVSFILGLLVGGILFYFLLNDGYLDFALFALITVIAVSLFSGYNSEYNDKYSQYINLLRDNKDIIFPMNQ